MSKVDAGRRSEHGVQAGGLRPKAVRLRRRRRTIEPAQGQGETQVSHAQSVMRSESCQVGHAQLDIFHNSLVC